MGFFLLEVQVMHIMIMGILLHAKYFFYINTLEYQNSALQSYLYFNTWL